MKLAVENRVERYDRQSEQQKDACAENNNEAAARRTWLFMRTVDVNLSLAQNFFLWTWNSDTSFARKREESKTKDGGRRSEVRG